MDQAKYIIIDLLLILYTLKITLENVHKRSFSREVHPRKRQVPRREYSSLSRQHRAVFAENERVCSMVVGGGGKEQPPSKTSIHMLVFDGGSGVDMARREYPSLSRLHGTEGLTLPGLR